ncbi:MAG: lyase family protein, partial [Dehalococcoidia bacterium]
ARVCAWLSDVLLAPIHETDSHFQAQSTLDGVVSASGALRSAAISLMKIANDIRLMGSGPRAGLGEIALPEVQPGSSIMPGKVNPVIAESLIMVGAQVIGNDATVATSGQWGYFELNTMMPVAAFNLLQSISLLAASARNFAVQCVNGLMATNRGPEMVERGLGIATAFAPEIGYDSAARIAKEAAKSGRSVREVALAEGVLSPERLNELLNPEAMTRPGHTGVGAGG